MGSVPPRLPPKDKRGEALGALKKPLVLSCDAQAFPVPLFRQVLS